jgi:O-antigen/teichoic acid export membrane protein
MGFLIPALAIFALMLTALGCNFYLLAKWWKLPNRWHHPALWRRVWSWGWAALTTGILIAFRFNPVHRPENELMEGFAMLLVYGGIGSWLVAAYFYRRDSGSDYRDRSGR